MPLPAIRPLEALPIEYEGQRYVCLSDPTGYIQDQLILSPIAYLVASGLTGFASVEDIQHEVGRILGGVMPKEDDIRRVVDQLDEHGFLATPRFDAHRQAIEEGFRNAPTRPAYLAGRAYPGEADALRTTIDGLFLREDGPNELPERDGADRDPLPGLIVPHIDYHRGGHSYAHGYRELARHGRPDTVIVFGVAHMAEPAPFILTRKPFETPLGTIDTDTDCLDKLEAACAWDPYEHELTHRTEHSVELQAVMIAHVFGTKTRIVPVLCSTFPDETRASDPAEDGGVARFLAACADYVSDSGKRVTVIASADLAHVGRRFGDDFEIDDAIVSRVRLRDEEDLVFANRIAGAEFYRSVMNDRNARKVCGVNCIYATLKTLEGRATRGKPLHYGYAPDPAGGIVSFASVALM